MILPADVSDLILSVCVIPNSSRDDFLSWEGSADGNFNSSSGYNMIEECLDQVREEDPEKNNGAWVSKIGCNRRTRYFMWLFANKAMLTRNNLVLPGLHTSLICPLCFADVETFVHIFFLRSKTVCVWNLTKINLSLLDNSCSLKDFVWQGGN